TGTRAIRAGEGEGTVVNQRGAYAGIVGERRTERVGGRGDCREADLDIRYRRRKSLAHKNPIAEIHLGNQHRPWELRSSEDLLIAYATGYEKRKSVVGV